MARKFFYAWQSERPGPVCRHFIREALETIALDFQQAGIDERVEVDSDTQDVPGVPEILSTILQKIDEDDLFVCDLTMCSQTLDEDKPRRSPNANVMFEYGYALKAKTRSRIICVMNTFYGGNDPTELPFDLRHARAPIRYFLPPQSTPDEKKKVQSELRGKLHAAAKLILDNLPNEEIASPSIQFEAPIFAEGDELTPEGDFAGLVNRTFFNAHAGFVYLKGRPQSPCNLSIADIKSMENGAAGMSISRGCSNGSFGSNKWGRVSYSLYVVEKKRLSSDYVQYFRTGEIEMINGSYFTIMNRDGIKVIHVGYLVTQIISPMLSLAKEWMEKAGFENFVIDVGVTGVEGWRITMNNFGAGPMIHVDKISVQKRVGKESVLLLAEDFRLAVLAEAGIA